MLTGLRNRNAYAQRLHDYASLENCEIASVYVDVNGLHEINNTKGHAAGDQMLRYVGKTMQNDFGARDAVGADYDVFSHREMKETILAILQKQED